MNETNNPKSPLRKSSLIFAGAGILTALFLVFSGFEVIHSAAAARSNPAAAKAAGATPDPPPAADGAPMVLRFVSNPALAPPFLVNDLDGNAVSSAAYGGKVVLLSFWATWCPPCRLEIPELIGLQKRYPDKLQVIGVSLDDNDTPEEVQKVADFAAQMGMNYPVVMARKELVEEYGGVPALPTTFVINTAGRVVQKHAGLISSDEYENEIRALLQMPVNAKVETFEDTGQVFLTNAARATQLPDVDLSGLTDAQKREALKRMNSENCNCGCGLTIAECRMNDTSCDVSKELAAEIVKEVKAGTPATPAKPAQP